MTSYHVTIPTSFISLSYRIQRSRLRVPVHLFRLVYKNSVQTGQSLLTHYCRLSANLHFAFALIPFYIFGLPNSIFISPCLISWFSILHVPLHQRLVFDQFQCHRPNRPCLILHRACMSLLACWWPRGAKQSGNGLPSIHVYRPTRVLFLFFQRSLTVSLSCQTSWSGERFRDEFRLPIN